MWRRSLKWSHLHSISSLLRSSHLNHPPTHFSKPTHLPKPPFFVPSPPLSFLSKPYSSSPPTNQETLSESEDDDSDEFLTIPARPITKLDPILAQNIQTITSSLRNLNSDAAGAKNNLESCGVPVSHDLVYEVLSRLRNEWSQALTFFIWAGKQPGYSHSVPNYHLMILILAKMMRFDTAWSVIDEMRKKGLVNPQTLLIMIRRYCASHQVDKAINVFYTFKKYGFKLGIEEFHGLLSALCKYKNVSDAEHLLFCNEKTFPFETKSFNIVLNGWCNVMTNVNEARRLWRDMERRGIEKDVMSYGSMISCFSKAGNLNVCLKIFDRMKEVGIEADLKVYNAMVYALAKGKCVDQARDLVKTMEEKGIAPTTVTYTSLIKPLCKKRRLSDARVVFDAMLNKGFYPSPRTYHAFFNVFTKVEEVFDLLNRMKQAGYKPVSETYILLIRKLSRWKQFESVFKLWDEMIENGISPSRSAYIVMIHGLFLNGKLEDAFKYYEVMKAKGFAPEPKTEEMIQAWASGNKARVRSLLAELEGQRAILNDTGEKSGSASNTHNTGSDFSGKPEMKSITREQGFKKT